MKRMHVLALGALVLLACGDDAMRMMADALRDAPAEAAASDITQTDDATQITPRNVIEASCEEFGTRTQITLQDGVETFRSIQTSYVATFTPGAGAVLVSATTCGRIRSRDPDLCPAESGTTSYECMGSVDFSGDCATGFATWDDTEIVRVSCGAVTTFTSSVPGVSDQTSGDRFTTATLVVE